MKKILILCTGNSCRSQMAEGWMRYYAGKDAEVYSAGFHPKGIHPIAAKVMMEAVIDISSNTSDSIEKYIDMDFDYIITVCDNANEKCPIFPGKAERIHQSFKDPADIVGDDKEVMDGFRKVRNQIEDYCFDFVDKNIRSLIPN